MAEPDREVPQGSSPIGHFRGPSGAGQENALGLQVQSQRSVGAAVRAPEREGTCDFIPRLQFRQLPIEIEPCFDPLPVNQGPGVRRMTVVGLRRIAAELRFQSLVGSFRRPGRRELQGVKAPAPDQRGGKPQRKNTEHAP